MKIGVFDSGVGGLSVAHAVQTALPQHHIMFRHDTPEHFPYATKTPDELYGYVLPLLQGLIADGCAVIVVACNTVSTTLIGRLRRACTVPLVAVEPMIKPAAQQTKSGVIAVCATPTTLASPRYRELKQLYAPRLTVLEPDCSSWSSLIEYNRMHHATLAKALQPCLAAGADVIVLGCTHYHWIQQDVARLAAGRAAVIQPEQAVVAQLKQVIAQLP